MSKQRARGGVFGAAAIALAGLLGGPLKRAQGQEISVEAVTTAREVYVGQPFPFNIRVKGSDSPRAPDLSVLRDFRVETLGGRQNNSVSITIINRQRNRVVRRGYTFSYRLTPTRAGKLLIPSLPVTVGRSVLRTKARTITAVPPTETADFKFRVKLAKNRCYVNEPVKLTATWYIAKDARKYHAYLPVADMDGLTFRLIEPARNANTRYLRISLGKGKRALAAQGRGVLGNKTFKTITFAADLIPKQGGVLRIPAATITFEGVVNYRLVKTFFGRVEKRPVYKTFVIPSNPLTLNVLPLPAAGRPAGFTGLVGRYSLTVEAEPTQVNVGDPITLTIRISGPSANLDELELPLLSRQAALARDFKIPVERAHGEVAGREKVFTQTIRATHADIKQIPALELPYFDPESRAYRVARSEPIPLDVRATRVTTAADAEGRELPVLGRTVLEELAEGIAHNYETLDALAPQRYGPGAWLSSPGWLALLILPPLGYFTALITTVVMQRRAADPAGRAAKLAYRVFARELKKLPADAEQVQAAVLGALRRYLGSKLRMASGTVTFVDVASPLNACGVPADTLAALQQLFEQCEAGRYAAGAAQGKIDDPSALAQRAVDAIRELEPNLS